MARTRVRLNGSGIRAVLNSAGVRAEVLRRAESVADAARSSAPVATGAYRDGIVVESATTDRAVGRVVATAAHSLVVEAKTRNLGSAIDAAGG